jgi:ABC-type bacteriocin/lantibiotic exporter with double-glycine peptidase domain
MVSRKNWVKNAVRPQPDFAAGKEMKKNKGKSGRKAKGGFFAALETLPYKPNGNLCGQEMAESCVPACTRMLILDLVPQAEHQLAYSESFLRQVFKTGKRGSSLRKIPEVLLAAGVQGYAYRKDLTFDELQQALPTSSVIVRLSGQKIEDGHVVIVDEINEDFVAVRDPLPIGQGTAYRVSLEAFLLAWQAKENGLGQAVVLE